jgi:hypothetical protein
LEPGDLVLSTTATGFGPVIRLITRSAYSHVAIVSFPTTTLVDATDDWRALLGLFGIPTGAIRVVSAFSDVYTTAPVVLRLSRSDQENAALAEQAARVVASTNGQYYAPSAAIAGLSARWFGSTSTIARYFRQRSADLLRPSAFCSQLVAAAYECYRRPVSDKEPIEVFPGDLAPEKIRKHGFVVVNDCLREISATWMPSVADPVEVLFFELGREVVNDWAARDAIAEYFLEEERTNGPGWVMRLEARSREPAGVMTPIFDGDASTPGAGALDPIVHRVMRRLNFSERLLQRARPVYIPVEADAAWHADVQEADGIRLRRLRNASKIFIQKILDRQHTWRDGLTLAYMHSAYEALVRALDKTLSSYPPGASAE